MPDWPAIVTALRGGGANLRNTVEPRPVGGGDINAAWCLEAQDETLFIKTASADDVEMFRAEAAGLIELASAHAVRVPKVIGCDSAGGDAFIALEWLGFAGGTPQTEKRLGEQLAELHRYTSRRFGWNRNNTIGRTPQNNPWSDCWVEFFRQHRLQFQLELAARNGYTGELQTLGRRLATGLTAFFVDYKPLPSLLHGDLWGGNWAAVDGDPVIFDPAVYYGDRETDIAMTRLFGGFGAAFYASYESSWPLAQGSAQRLELYQLYHVLNHLNLFGSGYLGRAIGSLRALNAVL